MPYVKCPSCHQVGYVAPSYRELDLCSRCGDALSSRRNVISIASHPRFPATCPGAAGERARSAVPAQAC